MKTLNNSFGVIFYLRKYKQTQKGETPIYPRITVNRKRSDISVKRTIDDKNWISSKRMAKGRREEINKLNNYLEKFRSAIVG